MHGATVNVDNLDTPEFMQFFENVASCVEPTANGGHIDIFAPIAACGELSCIAVLYAICYGDCISYLQASLNYNYHDAT